MFCTKCGNEQQEGSKFCSRCGASLDSGNTDMPSSDTRRTGASSQSLLSMVGPMEVVKLLQLTALVLVVVFFIIGILAAT